MAIGRPWTVCSYMFIQNQMNKFSWKLGEDTVRPPATLNVLNDWKSKVTTGQKPSHVGNNVIHGNVWSSPLGSSKTWAGVAFANSTSNYICLIYVATCQTTQEDRFWTLIHGLAMIVSSSAQPKKKWNVQRGSNFETRSIYLRLCNGPGKCVFSGGPTETVEVYPRFHMGTYTQGSIYVSFGGVARLKHSWTMESVFHCDVCVVSVWSSQNYSDFF